MKDSTFMIFAGVVVIGAIAFIFMRSNTPVQAADDNGLGSLAGLFAGSGGTTGRPPTGGKTSASGGKTSSGAASGGGKTATAAATNVATSAKG
jgi:hypothetical protein